MEVEHSKLYSASRNFITKYSDNMSFDFTKYESKEEDKTFFNKKLVYSGDIIEIESDMIMYKFNIFKLIVK